MAQQNPPHQERTSKNLCISVPDEVIPVLDEIAADRQMSRSALIRAAIEEYLGKPVNKPKPKRGRGWRRSNDGAT